MTAASPSHSPRRPSARDLLVAAIALSTILVTVDVMQATAATPGIGRTNPADFVAAEGTTASETDDIEDLEEHDLRPTACDAMTLRWSPSLRGTAVEAVGICGVAGRHAAAASIRGPPRPA